MTSLMQRLDTLEAVAQVDNPVRQMRLLRDLAPHVNGSLRPIAVTTVLDLTEIDQRFSAAAPYLDSLGEQGRSIVAEKLWNERKNSREDVLNVVSTSGVLEALSDEAVLRAARHVKEICREWKWWYVVERR